MRDFIQEKNEMHIEACAHIIYGYVQNDATAPLFDAIREKPDAEIDYVNTPFAYFAFEELHSALQQKHHVTLSSVQGKDGPVELITAYQYAVTTEWFECDLLPSGPLTLAETYRSCINDFLAELGVKTDHMPNFFLLCYKN